MTTTRNRTANNLDDTQAKNTLPASGATTRGGRTPWLAVAFALVLAMAIVPFHAADPASPAVPKGSALLPAPVTVGDTPRTSMAPARKPQPGSERITYMNYAPPAPLGLLAGGPSIGSNWRTDTLMYGAALQSLRLGFDDCSSPPHATWEDLNYVVSSEAPRDAVLFTDSQTGRTFVAYLAGGRSLMAFTDNDGWSWIRSNGGAITSDVDHQTVGGGVFHHPLTRDPNGSLYADAVYYCSQNSADASCARSDDGGLTFGPAVSIEASAECGGLLGHLRVAPDGTVYFPSGSCGDGQQALAVSEDNGASWVIRKVAGSASSALAANASLGIASDGTIYLGYIGRDGHPKVAVSHDKGLSWKNTSVLGMSFEIRDSAFPAIVAGDPDRAALAFMGSQSGGPGAGVDADSNGAWSVYVAHTYDGGLTWTTINATPNDPVELGSMCHDGTGDASCRSRDFMDATIDRLGRVVVGHAGGCGASCFDGSSDGSAVRASVARQVNGKRMFVQYDRLDVPAAPRATGTIDANDGSLAHLSWSTPDDHGSAITGYRIDRRTASGSFSPRAEIAPGLGFDDGIDPAESYVYRITAMNAIGEGPSCDQVLLTRNPANNRAVAAGPAPVVLGAAGTFGVLAASTVTSTGATTVHGDLGVSPGTTVAGAPTVTGTLHLGDSTAAQAQLDLTTAYNDAASRTVGAIGVTGNLGGRTLVPGLYKSTSSLEISSGDLTLDAQGDPNAVYIFQMASTLVTTTGRRVILSGGAQAANIFWQVGSSATLGTTSVFKGNILALASITVTTGATADGRLLARTGAVTLDTNVVGLAGAPTVTGPTVSSTFPANAATGVPIDAKIAAVFSEPMDASTMTTTTFILRQGTTQIAGRVTYIGTTATFTPVANLDPNTTYAATVTAGVKNLAGQALASAFAWSFTTSSNRDVTRPTVSYEVPVQGATGVGIRSKIVVTFSEPMDPLTIDTNTFVLRQAGGSVAGTVTYVGVTAVFTPTVSLAPLTLYTARIKPGAKDLAGNALAGAVNGFAWSFTTGAAPDTTRPTVTFTVPANGATGVPISQKIAATFSEPMDPLTTTTLTYSLTHGTTPVVGTVTYAGVTATFTPLSPLAPSTAYTATITTGTKDLAGNGLAAAFVWSFTTGVAPDTIRPTVTFTVPANAATGVAITQKIAATFSEAMDPLTTTNVTYTLKQGATPVIGTVTFAGVTATFDPLNALTPSTVYTATITTGAKDLAGNALAAAFVWSFTTGVTADTTRPTVSLVIPANTASGVAISGNISAAFSEAMDPLTTTTVTFTLKQGTTPVVGTVTYAGVTATFNPLNTLAPLTTYTATITTGATDLAGNALANEFVWSFTTGVTPDTTRPTVSLTVPANSAIGVAITQKIVGTFSEAMDPSTINTVSFTLNQGTTAVAGTVVYIGVTATFTPAAALAPLTVYTAAITTGAKDLAGNALLSNFGWSFTTGATPDTTRPTVSSTVPANAATAVAINQTVNATFSEPMDPLTINTASLTLRGPSGAAVTGLVSYAVASKIATFTPTSNLAPNAVYTATVTTGARDLAGNAVVANFVFTFTTAATVAGQSSVALGSASTFAVLAGSTITNTGLSTVNGDLGLSPGTAVTGFPPGIVNGTIHAGDPASAQAQLDLTIAYNDAAGRTLGAIGVGGNLGGQTLTPGLYKSTSSLEISSGDLTLDAQGDANAVFIFQMASTLTTTTARQVILSGGAQAANVFWQVGSSATLGTGSSFKGNILASASITVTTGAAVEGRLLARTGAVTLDTSVVGLAIPADITAPTISFTVPNSAATGVPISGKIAATFSEAMNPLTIGTSSFTVKQGLTAVAGTVSYVGVTATFTPASALAPLTAYTATITTGATDLAGNALGSSFVWGFTTGVTPDTTRPTVSVTVPVNAAIGVAINQTITAAFSEAMDPLTINPVTFTLKQGTTAVAGTVVYIGVTATFTPAAALAPLTVYTAAITTGAKDLAGNALLSSFGWSFTTGATPDTIRPTVSSTVPANAATAVAINQTVNATFSEPMDPLTINTASLTLRGPSGAAVTGLVSYAVASKIATFTPTSNLAPNAVYTATVTTGARDLAGNAVVANFVFTFTTAATAAGQSSVALGSASTFAVLAGSTITNTGLSTVNGDLGLSPGTAVTGFPPGIVNGTIHAGDPASAQAQLDLTIAYNDAAGRTLGVIGVGGNLGGQTLTPGLYKSTSSLEISSGDLTLDAQGDANAVFIFQMASTLTTTTARQVILSGGAQAANVFWQVGSSATLGTGSSFKGNILASASITVTTGATVQGRLLARTGAVTLDTSLVGF